MDLRSVGSMRPRLVDWTLFTLVAIVMLSGFGSFLVGRPEGRWVFVAHGIVGAALIVVLGWKVRRIWPRLIHARLWDAATVGSVLALAAVLLVLISGIGWTTWQWPVAFPNGMWWHITFGIALALLLLTHIGLRFKPLRRRDLQGRRTLLQLLAVGVGGGILWGGHQLANQTWGTSGARRRFTGSRLIEGDFPVTMWMLDNPAPLDLANWQLQIGGAVVNPITIDIMQLMAVASDEIEATLDCTSGWYTRQTWRGVSVAKLLTMVRSDQAARLITFHSNTGYRWSLPLAEAKNALLATHVGGERLSHGHGAPLRLVAPGRRGFQWVKWVTAMEVRSEPDFGQWAAIFTSGLGPKDG